MYNKARKKNQTIELQKSEQIGPINELELISDINKVNSIYLEIYKKLIEEDTEKKNYKIKIILYIYY